LIIAAILGHFGQIVSWIIGGLLVFLVLIINFVLLGASLQYFILASLSIFGYNIGLILTLTTTLVRANSPTAKI